MELPLLTPINKEFLFSFIFFFREISYFTEYFSFFNGICLDFKGSCVKGKLGLIFLPLTMWSH